MHIFGAVDTATVTAISDGAAGVKDNLVAIATNVLPYAASLLALTLGWRFAKRFVRG
jgi:hypothetical protein